MMDRTPKPGELYRHFKNKLYQIVTVATHSETGEKPEDMSGKSISLSTNAIAANAPEAVSVQTQACYEPAPDADEGQAPDADEGQAPDPRLLEFLDADTFEEKYNILISMRDIITDRLIDDIAVVMDVVVPEGPLQKRYDDLKNTIKTRQYYEFSNRLR